MDTFNGGWKRWGNTSHCKSKMDLGASISILDEWRYPKKWSKSLEMPEYNFFEKNTREKCKLFVNTIRSMIFSLGTSNYQVWIRWHHMRSEISIQRTEHSSIINIWQEKFSILQLGSSNSWVVIPEKWYLSIESEKSGIQRPTTCT